MTKKITKAPDKGITAHELYERALKYLNEQPDCDLKAEPLLNILADLKEINESLNEIMAKYND